MMAAAQVRGRLKKDEDDAPPEEGDIDLSSLRTLEDSSPAMRAVAADAAAVALAQVGVDAGSDGLTNQVFDRAVDYAAARSGEMVSQVTDATRDRIRELVAKGLADNVGRDGIAKLLEDDLEFSEERAERIANYEVTAANGAGKLEGYRLAIAAGVDVEKEWLADEGACPECLANEAQGPIPVDEPFQSGAMAEPDHVNCECSVIPRVKG
jgi:hypothetical protein